MANFDDLFTTPAAPESPSAPPQLTKEEYAAKKKAEMDAVYQMIDDTAAEIVSDPDKFRAYLDTQARMDRYSAANALLIYKQQPQATQLKDFRDWQEDGVKVNKGAKSLSILEPVEYTKNDGSTGIAYNVKKVFDVAQTSGKKPAAPTLDRDPRKLVAIMLDTAPIDVSTVEELPSPNMGAFYKNEDQTLYIKRDIGDSVALCQCVAQELGHAQLAMNCEAYSRRDMGFSAVCVGYMLCRKFGVDVKNFAIDRIPEELAGKSPKEIRAELSKTRTAMREIGSRVSEEIYRRRAERSKEQERRGASDERGTLSRRLGRLRTRDYHPLPERHQDRAEKQRQDHRRSGRPHHQVRLCPKEKVQGG